MKCPNHAWNNFPCLEAPICHKHLKSDHGEPKDTVSPPLCSHSALSIFCWCITYDNCIVIIHLISVSLVLNNELCHEDRGHVLFNLELIVLTVVIKHRRYSICICWMTVLQPHTSKCLWSIALCIFLWNLKSKIQHIQNYLPLQNYFFILTALLCVTTVLINQTRDKATTIVASYLISHIQITAQVYPSFSLPEPISKFKCSLPRTWASLVYFKPGVLFPCVIILLLSSTTFNDFSLLLNKVQNPVLGIQHPTLSGPKGYIPSSTPGFPCAFTLLSLSSFWNGFTQFLPLEILHILPISLTMFQPKAIFPTKEL